MTVRPGVWPLITIAERRVAGGLTVSRMNALRFLLVSSVVAACASGPTSPAAQIAAPVTATPVWMIRVVESAKSG